MISGQNVDDDADTHTADYDPMPVSEACEEAGILCLSVDTPDEAWAASDHQYSYHAGFNTENELLCFLDAWKAAGVTSGKIGVMHADDAEGQAMMAAITAFALHMVMRYVIRGLIHRGHPITVPWCAG